MRPNHAWSGRIVVIALAFCLAGCSESSPFRFGSTLAEGPPKPAPALYIPNPPATVQDRVDDKVQRATFVPDREAPKPQINPEMIENPLRALHQRAVDTHAKMDSYVFRLRSREVANGKKQPETLARAQVRRAPYSVRLVWLNDKSKGREAIYVQGKYNNQMQILLEPSNALALLGRRHRFDPNDSLVRAESRHPITNTGFGSMIDGYGRLVAALEKGDTRLGTAKYLGQVKREEFAAKVEAVHQVLPAGSDPLLPKGGQRWWFFDAANGLPVLVITHDATGEVEYYCHDHIQAPAGLDDRDFDADRLWGK